MNSSFNRAGTSAAVHVIRSEVGNKDGAVLFATVLPCALYVVVLMYSARSSILVGSLRGESRELVNYRAPLLLLH